MDKQSGIIVLIPAYKPDARMVELVRELRDNHLDVMLVDDGGQEPYAPLFAQCRELGAEVAVHTVNLGKGRALKTGINAALLRWPDLRAIVTADADGQHTPRDILRLIDAVDAHPNTLVLGSRKFTGDVPFKSRWGNRITRTVYGLASGVHIYDTQTGLRGFDRDCMRLFVDVPGDRYEYEINMLLTAARAEMPIYEVTIETVYLNDNESSHFNPLKDSLRIYACILKFACSSLICFGIDYVLFQLLRTFIPLTWVSNLLARIVSASVNFTLNKKLVFKGNEKTLPAVLKYAALAVFIYLIDTAILALVYEKLGWSRYVVKIISGLLGYLISFSVQGRIVYRKQKH